MATPAVPASILLYEAADELKPKGRYARAAEKLGCAAAAAAAELAAEDCFAVAFLQAMQAESLNCHSMAPNLTVAERGDARQTVVSVLLPQIWSTLTRRKAAGTLLPGSCRAAEVEWWRIALERKLLRADRPAQVARAYGVASAPEIGFETCMAAAAVALDVLVLPTPLILSREMELSHAAFVASAFELMAQPRELSSAVVNGVKKLLTSSTERLLAGRTRWLLARPELCYKLDGEVLSLMTVAWRRVERSGAVAMRELDGELEKATSIHARLAEAAAEAAVRGLRKCALAGCAAKEVHVSQFKRCSACQQAFYCCREHQLEDWPAHKAACKAARKAALPAETS